MGSLVDALQSAWASGIVSALSLKPRATKFLASTALALCLGVATARAAAPATPDPAALKFFESEVRPLLSENCYKCHGDKKQKGGLRLDHVSYQLTGGERGPAIVPGKPDASLIIKAVSRTDPDLKMPPEDPLSAGQVAILKRWIALGAPWPAGEALAKPARKPGVITDEDRQWWAFQPVKRPTVPKNSARHPVDAFLAARLRKEGLTMSPAAGRTEWVRRAYFDLHGLPPTPEEIQAFVQDRKSGAEERLIDRLLASPRYGERWAQHWLDLVRYAESDGYRADGYRSNAWPYRDYVIRSFNQNKPYDRFVKEQLAGDELAPDDPDVVIGTAFLRHGIYEWNQRDVVGQWSGILNEVTDVTSDVFLGLSMQCARCHDHKFDPILHKDYYRLQAFFSGLAWPEDRVLATTEERRRFDEQQQKWEAATKEIREGIEAIIGPPITTAEKKFAAIFPDDIKVMFAKPADARTSREEQLVQLASRQIALERPKFKDSSVPKPQQEKLKQLRAQLATFDAIKPKPLLRAFVASDVCPEVSPTTYRSRGAGEQTVQPGFLTILNDRDPVINAPKTGVLSSGRRTALAEWIASPANPLTARVIVNRVWQYHFGRGLSSAANDFGHLGEKPSHPELLDWLAGEFVASGWQLKHLHKLIMTSAAYRQTARRTPGTAELQKDPENRLLWRFSPHRLDAGQARDAILAISGELNGQMGGEGVEATQPRRSVYTRKLRNTPDPFLGSLDAPPGFTSVPTRDATTTPLQALLFVNGDWPLQRAHKMAKRLLTGTAATNDAAVVQSAWQLALGRTPSSDEKRHAEEFLRAQRLEIVRHALLPVTFSEPLVDAIKYFDTGATTNLPKKSFYLQPASPHEKLRVPMPVPADGDGFAVEAVVKLESLAEDASVRTIVSRWNGSRTERGWALGVTGAKSDAQPGTLVLEISGDDFQASLLNEAILSGLSIAPGHSYYVAASLSYRPPPGHKFGGTVTFYARDLSTPDAPLQTVTVPHSACSSVTRNDRAVCVGGRDRDPRNLWHGAIARVTLRSSPMDAASVGKPAGREATEIVGDRAESMLASSADNAWRWENSGAPPPGVADAPMEAVADLCHALLNSNEFLYLH